MFSEMSKELESSNTDGIGHISHSESKSYVN